MTKIGGIHIYSCYVPPIIPRVEYEQILDNLFRDALTTMPSILAGDYNPWALEWGSKGLDQPGHVLLKALSILNVILLNTGAKSTSEMNGRGCFSCKK